MITRWVSKNDSGTQWSLRCGRVLLGTVWQTSSGEWIAHCFKRKFASGRFRSLRCAAQWIATTVTGHHTLRAAPLTELIQN